MTRAEQLKIYRDSVNKSSKKRKLDPDLVWAMMNVESSYDPKSVSSVGARGLLQVMPATAATITNRADTAQLNKDMTNDTKLTSDGIIYSIDVACQYLAILNNQYDRNHVLVVGAYHGGDLEDIIGNHIRKPKPDITMSDLLSVPSGHNFGPKSKKYVQNVNSQYIRVSNGKKSLGLPGSDTSHIPLATNTQEKVVADGMGSLFTLPIDIYKSITKKHNDGNMITPPPIIPNTTYDDPIVLNDYEYEVASPINIYAESGDADYFKLGDVVLKVPPQSISMQEYNSTYSYPTVRTKGSPKMKTGQEDMMINVECMFPRAVDINGYTDNDMWYGGLRSIIAHYYRIPFCPIENPTIRKIVYPNVDTLINQDVPNLTIPGDTEEKTTDLTTNTQTDQLITNILNTAREPEKDRVDAKKSKEDIRELRDETPPTTPGVNTRLEDAMIAVVLDTLTVSTVPGYPNSLQASMTLKPFNFIPFSNDFSFVRSEADVIAQSNYYKGIHDNKNPSYTPIVPTYNISDCEPAKKYYKGLLSEFATNNIDQVYTANDMELLYPVSNDPRSNITLKYFYTIATRQSLLMNDIRLTRLELEHMRMAKSTVDQHVKIHQYRRIITQGWRTFKAYFAIVPYNYAQMRKMFRTRLGIDNPDKFLFDPQTQSWQERERYIDNAVANLIKDNPGLTREKFIKGFGDILDEMIDNAKIDADNTKTINLDGPGRMVTGITATFKNKTAPIRTEGQIYPVYQYMGRGDVQFSINMQTTDEDFLSEIRELNYRTNYTQLIANSNTKYSNNTFVDTSAWVEGEFFKLFGVNKVIISDVTYSTVNEHPGLYNISMSMISADMDLRKYERLVGQRMINANLLSKVVDALLDRDHITWDKTSMWERISRDIADAKPPIDEAEAKKKDEVDRLHADLKNIKDEAKEINSQAKNIFQRFTAWVCNNVAGIATQIALIAEDAAELHMKWDTKKVQQILFKNIQMIKVMLDSNPKKYIPELNNPEIAKMMDQDILSNNNFNTCYADMSLPGLGGDPLDIPPDFFYRRQDIVTNDSINQCLQLINASNANKLLESIIMNFEGIQDQLDDDTTGLGQRFMELYTKTDRTPEDMNELRSMLERVGINASNPLYALSVIKTIEGAIGSKHLDDRIDQAEKEIQAAQSRYKAIGMSDNEIKRKMDQNYTYLSQLKQKRAEYENPAGIVTSNQDQIGEIGVANWYGQSFSDMETLEIQQRALESRKSENTLQMARAFPTIKLYFIEEDAAQWLLWDDFYSYAAIRSCDIVKSTESASDTAVIRVSNISNILTNPLADYQHENWTVDNTSQEQYVDRLMLRVGCPIMILMGYDNNPMRLPMVFLGAISQMSPGEGEIEIIAQSWGAQLHSPVTAKGESKGWWGLDKAHGDVVTWALGKVPGMRHLGNKSIFNDADDPTRDRVRDTAMSYIINSLFASDMGSNNPRDDNVYFPYNTSIDPTTRLTFDWHIDQGQTAWEVIQECLLWYPDWIATILPYYPDPERIYDRRLTLYVGPMDGYYKYTDKYDNVDWKWHQEAVKNNIDTGMILGNSVGGSSPEENMIDRALNNNGVANGEELFSPEYVYLVNSVAKLVVRRSGGAYDLKGRVKGKVVIIGHTDPSKGIIEFHKEKLKDKDYNDRVLIHEVAHYLTSSKYRIDATKLPKKDYWDDPIENVARIATLIVWLGSNNYYYDVLDSPVSKNQISTIQAGEQVDIRRFTEEGSNLSLIDMLLNGAGRFEDIEGGHPGKLVYDIEFEEARRIADIMNKIIASYKTGNRNPDIENTRSSVSGGNENISENWQDQTGYTAGKSPKNPDMKYPANKGSMFYQGKLLKCFKGVIDYHFFDSDHHIIDNSISATTDNMYNRVILAYPGGLLAEPIYGYERGKFDATYEMSIDDDIKEDYIRSYVSYQKNIDTNWWVDCFEPMMIHRMKTRRDYKSVKGANGKDIIDEKSGNYLNGIPQYIRVANTILNNQCREMYNGSITIIGDPTVKPWDYCYIYDFQNEMNGPVQVKEVVHRFNAETGFTTIIKPMLVSHCQNFQATLDTNYIGYTWLFGAIHGLFNKTLLQAPGYYYGMKAGQYGWGKLANAAWTKGVLTKFAATTAGRIGARAIPIIGWGILAYDILDSIKHVGLTFQKEFGRLMGRQPIIITPLSYAGRPLLAGVEGMRTDNMWVHTIDSISSVSDIPRSLIVSAFTKGSNK